MLLPVNFISGSPTTILLAVRRHHSMYMCVCRGAISTFETLNAQSILQFVHQVVINKLNTLCGRRGRGGSNPRPAAGYYYYEISSVMLHENNE